MANNPRRSATQWAQLMSEYRESGETEQEFCQHHGLNFHTFRKWKYRQSSAKPRGVTSAPKSSFVKVISPPRAAPTLRIHLGAELSIECPSGMAIEEVARLAGALRDGR